MSVVGSGARRTVRLLCRWAAKLILLALALLVAASLVVVIVLPRATHGAAMTVLTGSMTPEIPIGSVVLVRPVDPSTLQVGDVATYQAEPGKEAFITHRIVGIDRSTNPISFTFKGDANRGPDIKPIPAGAIRGEVWFHVPYLGAIRDALHGKGGISLIAMLALAGYALSQLSAGLRERRDRRRPEDYTGSEPTAITVDRTLILVKLDTARVAELADLTPKAAAEHWGCLLMAQEEDTFTVLVAPLPDGAIAAVELLTYLEPLEIAVCEPPNAIVGAAASPEVLALIQDRGRPAATKEESRYVA